jgi:hypothetical protein
MKWAIDLDSPSFPITAVAATTRLLCNEETDAVTDMFGGVKAS